MKSAIVKRSVVIAGHKTSVSLEDAFWAGLKDIARQQSMLLTQIVARIEAERRQGSNLTSAIRLFVLDYYRARCLDASASRPAAEFRGGDATARV